MLKSVKIIISLLLTLQFLGAADQYLPKMELIPIPGGIRVQLDFQHVTLDQWQSMLENPELFTKYGWGIAGAPGDPATPMTTQMVPVSSTQDIRIEAVQRQDEVLQNTRLMTVPEVHLDSEPSIITSTLYDDSHQDRRMRH